MKPRVAVVPETEYSPDIECWTAVDAAVAAVVLETEYSPEIECWAAAAVTIVVKPPVAAVVAVVPETEYSPEIEYCAMVAAAVVWFLAMIVAALKIAIAACL